MISTILQRLDQISRESFDYLARVLAVQLGKNLDTIALPIMSSSHIDSGPALSRVNVLRITLRSIPIPVENTPLEAFLDFRSDPDVRTDFLALHRWASTTALMKKQPSEISEEVEYLIGQYQKHMLAHKIEAGVGVIENVVTVSAETLEDLIKLKWELRLNYFFHFVREKLLFLS